MQNKIWIHDQEKKELKYKYFFAQRVQISLNKDFFLEMIHDISTPIKISR